MTNYTTIFCYYIIQHSKIYSNYKNVISSMSRNPLYRDDYKFTFLFWGYTRFASLTSV